MDDTTIRVMRLASQGLYCSQIIMSLALETAGRENPELIRSLAGLAFGGGTGQGGCGVLTGGCCVLALYAGRGAANEQEHPALMPMLEEFGDWFAEQAQGEGGGVSCAAIMGEDVPRQPQQKCGLMVAQAFGKLVEMLMANGFDLANLGAPDEY